MSGKEAKVKKIVEKSLENLENSRDYSKEKIKTTLKKN